MLGDMLYLYCILVPDFLHYHSLNCYPCLCHLLVNELLNLTRCLALLRILISVARKKCFGVSHLSVILVALVRLGCKGLVVPRFEQNGRA